MIDNQFIKLMLVTAKQNKPLDEYLTFITQCAQSGITAVQLREKNFSYSELLEFGEELQKILNPLNIPLIINDNVELAVALNAAGVHLGQTDGDVCEARKRLGNNKIIGVSIDSIAQLKIANTLSIDYVGVGAIFPTQNKKDVQTIWGCEGLKELSTLSTHPIIAIGGVDESNAKAVMHAGADGLAAIGAFHDADDIIVTTKKLRQITEDFNHA